MEAPLGCFCSFGNHDYERYVSLNGKGQYDICKPINPAIGLLKGLRTLCSKTHPFQGISMAARSVSLHTVLCDLLNHTPFYPA